MAVLLFHPDPEMYVTGAYIKIGYFQSETEVRYHDEIHGDLFTQDEALEKCKKTVKHTVYQDLKYGAIKQIFVWSLKTMNQI